MVIDTSALLAILLDEPERLVLTVAIDQADTKRLSVAGFVEASMVLEARIGAEGARDLDDFLTLAGIEVEPVTVEQGRLAARAFARFGKGRHAAGLNFGDCFAYALAKEVDEPLLFKGDDFAKTDASRA
jgi:ribonuclease VapC